MDADTDSAFQLNLNHLDFGLASMKKRLTKSEGALPLLF